MGLILIPVAEEFYLVHNYCTKIVYLKSDGEAGFLAISDFED